MICVDSGHRGKATITNRMVDQLPPLIAYFSPSWTAFQTDRGRCFSAIVDDLGPGNRLTAFAMRADANGS